MNTHPTHEEDFDLYALGALEDEEKVALETHVATCDTCTRKLAEARGRIALLAFAAPTVEPSPAVKQRLIAQVRAGERASTREAVVTPALSAAPLGTRPAEDRSRGFGRWWTPILAPATLAFALVSVYLWKDNNRLQHAITDQQAALTALQNQADSTRTALARYEGEAEVRTAVWTGWISDSHCGAKGMSAAHKDCAMQCIREMHSQWVFVETKTKKIYTIHNQQDVKPETSLGAEMKVTGWMMDDGTLQVEKISASR